MTSIQPDLWVENPREALAFYGAAFGATIIDPFGHEWGDRQATRRLATNMSCRLAT